MNKRFKCGCWFAGGSWQPCNQHHREYIKNQRTHASPHQPIDDDALPNFLTGFVVTQIMFDINKHSVPQSHLTTPDDVSADSS